MTTLIIILLIAAACTFGYLVYRVGWGEALAATAALFVALWAAITQFAGSFGG